jgi:hypothetical protein
VRPWARGRSGGTAHSVRNWAFAPRGKLGAGSKEGLVRSRTGPIILAVALLAAACDSGTSRQPGSPASTQAGGGHTEHQGGAAPAATPKALAAQL